MRVIRYVSLAACLFAPTQCYGLNMSEFRGRLTGGTQASYDGYVIEINNLVDRTIREHADVSSDGNFVFRAIADGDYMVSVLSMYGSEITSTIASVGPASTGLPCEIRLPQPKLQKPISGTVSLQQLSHPLTKQVRKLLDSGQKLMADRHYGDAAVRFREAAQDDPQCAQAHAELGLALARMGTWDSAIDEYRAATKLDPRNSVLHSNLSAVLASAKRFDDAETEASAALKLDPQNARAHFVMAGALLKTNGRIPDVVAHLSAAKDAFPTARRALEELCATENVTGCP
jgi:tetratricopeptide (TPR) repeat protein